MTITAFAARRELAQREIVRRRVFGYTVVEESAGQDFDAPSNVLTREAKGHEAV